MGKGPVRLPKILVLPHLIHGAEGASGVPKSETHDAIELCSSPRLGGVRRAACEARARGQLSPLPGVGMRGVGGGGGEPASASVACARPKKEQRKRPASLLVLEGDSLLPLLILKRE